jgi:membrane protease YdiL (CAAX protease family)
MSAPTRDPGTAAAAQLVPARATTSGFRGFAARRPVAALLIMVFSISYPIMAVVALAVHQVIPGYQLIDRLPIPPDELAGLLLTLVALLPAALYVTWAADGREGLRQLLRRVSRWRFGVGWWLFVLTALPLLTVGVGLVLGDTPQPVDPVALLLGQVPLLMINLLLVNLWEETAWAGVMQTRLERRHNLFVAAFLTSIPFGAAHWPLAFLGDVTPLSAVISLFAYILLGALVRPLAALSMRGSRDSVLAFALLHSVFNRTNNHNGIVATLLNGDAHQVGILIVLPVLTIAASVVLRHKLGPSYRRHLDRMANRQSLRHQPDTENER